MTKKQMNKTAKNKIIATTKTLLKTKPLFLLKIKNPKTMN